MSEPLFNVVIERPRSSAPDAVAALAAAIAARYGIPAADLERRIARGSFRVKSRVDRTTADTYAADLTRLGAVCAVLPVDEGRAPSSPPSGDGEPVTLPQVGRDGVRPATGQGPRVAAEAVRPPSDRAPRVAAEAVRPATGQGARLVAEAARPASERGARVSFAPPSEPAARPASDRGPRLPLEAPAEPERSAAPAPARSGNPLDLGALSGEMPLLLSTLDGAAADGGAARGAQLPASFGPPAPAPPPEPAPAPSSSSPRLPRAGSGGGPASAPTSTPAVRGPAMPLSEAAEVDRRFAPPDAGVEVEVALETAVPSRRELAGAAQRSTGPTSTTPPPAEQGRAAVTLPPRVGEGARVAAATAVAPAPAVRGTGLRDARIRLVAGAVLAVGLGFVPAHVVATLREHSVYTELDRELTRKEATIRTREEWETFAGLRDAIAERKRDARRNIALLSLVVWAAVGGGVAYVWFRKLDWDRLLPAR